MLASMQGYTVLPGSVCQVSKIGIDALDQFLSSISCIGFHNFQLFFRLFSAVRCASTVISITVKDTILKGFFHFFQLIFQSSTYPQFAHSVFTALPAFLLTDQGSRRITHLEIA